MSSIRRSLTVLLIVLPAALTVSRSVLANNGGIVGGGGNVIVSAPPNQRLSVEETHRVIAAAMRATKYTLFDYETKLRAGPGLGITWAHLFSEKPDVYTVLHFERVEIRDRASCSDAAGVSFDGSTLSPYPGTICISAKRLAEKVEPAEMKIQAIALIVHEISECLGLTDREAISLQKDILAEYDRPNKLDSQSGN